MMERIWNDKKGGAFIEVAVMLPIILTLLMGYVTMMNTVRQQLVIQTAVREGARAFANPALNESVSAAAARAERIVREELRKNRVDPTTVNVKVFPDGYKRYVTATRPFMLTPLTRWLLGGVFRGEIRAATVFHVEPFDRPAP